MLGPSQLPHESSRGPREWYGPRPVRLSTQCRALADEPGAVRASRERATQRDIIGDHTSGGGSPGGDRGDARDRDRPRRPHPATTHSRARRGGRRGGHDGVRRSVPVHTRASATSIGTCKIPKAGRSTRSAPSATRSAAASTCSSRSSIPPPPGKPRHDHRADLNSGGGPSVRRAREARWSRRRSRAVRTHRRGAAAESRVRPRSRARARARRRRMRS